MTELHVVFTLGAVAQVSKKKFTHHGNMTLEKTRVPGNVRLVFFEVLNLFMNFGKNFRYRLVIIAADPVKKGVTGFNIKFYSGDARTVLTTVVLFFHQQIQLVQAVQCRTIFLEIKGERFAKPDECQPAFMFNVVAQFVLF